MSDDRAAWNTFWSSKRIFHRVLTLGRSIYNRFFERLIIRFLPPGGSLIELGCGSGSTFSKQLSKHAGRYVGVDNAPDALALAQDIMRERGITNAEFVLGDILSPQSAQQNQFDLVWSQGLMEHFPDYQAVVTGHLAVAKPGGTVLISVPYLYSYIYIWYLLTNNRLLSRFWPYVNQHFLTRSQLHELGEKSGGKHRVFFLPPAVIGLGLGIVILAITKPQQLAAPTTQNK